MSAKLQPCDLDHRRCQWPASSISLLTRCLEPAGNILPSSLPTVRAMHRLSRVLLLFSLLISLPCISRDTVLLGYIGLTLGFLSMLVQFVYALMIGFRDINPCWWLGWTNGPYFCDLEGFKFEMSTEMDKSWKIKINFTIGLY
jgi:hypothetical protein